MIEKVTNFVAICDDCGCTRYDSDSDYLEENAINDGWQWIGGKFYCPDCVERVNGGFEKQDTEDNADYVFWGQEDFKHAGK